jgi:dTDP-4-amino-4,6-dideoxygalactose transaminase
MASQPTAYSVSAEAKPRTGPLESGLGALARQVAGFVPVLQPRLPRAAEILPYLEAIDERRWYSNYGQIVTRLEEQLSLHLGMASPGVVTSANATAGLTAALLARQVPAGAFCIMPSWTFAATPHAARAAGLTPWFHDVDRRTWALNPVDVQETLRRIPGHVGAVMVVSPFGAPLDIAGWEAFENRTGVPVVVDAAAGFDAARASRIPVVVSLHATKVLGAGEGGFVATTDEALRDRLRACCNFGFHGSRTAMLPALNAKMSEYHAAVALAGLANWPAIRARHVRVSQWYRRSMAGLPGVHLQPGYGEGWAGSTTSVELPARSLAEMTARLLQAGIETRAWWGQGCHVQPAFAACPRGPLPVTEDLGSRVLGLPHFPDIRESEVDAVAAALAEALGQRMPEAHPEGASRLQSPIDV